MPFKNLKRFEVLRELPTATFSGLTVVFKKHSTSRNLPVKVHLKKKPEIEKLDGI
jgi:hypothetical protein